MEDRTELLVNKLLHSYEKYDNTCRIDAESMLSKQALIDIVEEIRKILFPGFFDNSQGRSEYIKFLVGERLEFIQYNLQKQIAKTFGSQDMCSGCHKSEINAKAEDIVYRFLDRLDVIREYLHTDIEAAYDGDPAAYSTDEIIFSYPGVFAITVYRIAHELWLLGVPMIPRIMTEYAHSSTGIDIHPGASIGKYFFIDHGYCYWRNNANWR